jgi:hypothetical protein
MEADVALDANALERTAHTCMVSDRVHSAVMRGPHESISAPTTLPLVLFAPFTERFDRGSQQQDFIGATVLTRPAA